MTGTFRPEPEASAELEDAALWYDSQRQDLAWSSSKQLTSRWSRSPTGRRSAAESMAYPTTYPRAESR